MQEKLENESLKKIIITKKDNSKVEGKIIVTFLINGENFVLYQIENKIFGGKIDQTNSLSPILNDEWKIVEKIFNEYLENNPKLKEQFFDDEN